MWQKVAKFKGAEYFRKALYPYQKPWITGNIRSKLKDRAAAFKEREANPDAYKKSRYALRRTIKQAKHQYRIKIQSYYTGFEALCFVAGHENYYGQQRENQTGQTLNRATFTKPRGQRDY